MPVFATMGTRVAAHSDKDNQAGHARWGAKSSFDGGAPESALLHLVSSQRLLFAFFGWLEQ